MARKYFTEVREEKAIEFTLYVEGLEDYMTAWLAISNNVRDNKDSFYQLRNCSSNNYMYVVSNPEDKDAVKRFLSQFGPITNEVETTAVVVDVSCEYDNFDKDWIDCEYVLGETD